MSHTTEDLPEPLSIVGATDLERRLIAAGAREQPSPELTARMAATIGISSAAVGIATATVAAGTSAGTKGTAATSALLPWISAGVVVLALGGFAGIRAWTSSAAPPLPTPTPAAAPAIAPAIPTGPPAESAAPAEPSRAVATPTGHRRSAGGTAIDLHEQILLIDAARAATAAGDGQRALERLRRYRERYPAGSFRPEAAALRVEALVELGRMTEARELAERFIAEHGASPLADRVARLVRNRRP